MPKRAPETPIESHGFHFASRIVKACEQAGLPKQDPFTPIRDGKKTKAERQLLLLLKEAVDMIELYRMQGMVVPYALDETQDIWNSNRKNREEHPAYQEQRIKKVQTEWRRRLSGK